ncbi:hypothetical protein RIF29_28280 [Crotalaria pallida]|uniref:Uncharacterized protein n=1 Tax=Crotalaria pallida TaxID=3830 RepID=A0AAN9I390_CROPI
MFESDENQFVRLLSKDFENVTVIPSKEQSNTVWQSNEKHFWSTEVQNIHVPGINILCFFNFFCFYTFVHYISSMSIDVEFVLLYCQSAPRVGNETKFHTLKF